MSNPDVADLKPGSEMAFVEPEGSHPVIEQAAHSAIRIIILCKCELRVVGSL